MKKIILILIILACGWIGIRAEEARDALPRYIQIELKRIEETWNVLGQFAEKIWPGWRNYPDIPFLIEYPNGVQLLVGHPSPIEGFEPVPGVEIHGKKVFLYRIGEIVMPMEPPFLGGGGILRWGKEKQVQTVDLRLFSASRNESGLESDGLQETEEMRKSSEKQILINVHELFHCFQRTVYQYRFGNFRFNPDLDFAVYSDIEGQALEKAFLAAEDSQARAYLVDFLAARFLKKKGMKEIEANQEAEDELMEGTAVYSEAMALELMVKGYIPQLTEKDDPWFHSFKDREKFLNGKLRQLRTDRASTLEARGRCYSYGCFQSLLLSRLFSGWQQTFFQDKKLLDEELQQRLQVPDQDLEEAAAKIPERYGLEQLKKLHGPRIAGRDQALKMIESRTGRSYVINFKPVREYLHPKGRGESYQVGLMNIFPHGIEHMKIESLFFSSKDTPVLLDQLYYLKWVDIGGEPGKKGFSLKYKRKEGDNVFIDAEVQTAGFVLKAPKIEIRESPARVKIIVLKKIGN